MSEPATPDPQRAIYSGSPRQSFELLSSTQQAALDELLLTHPDSELETIRPTGTVPGACVSWPMGFVGLRSMRRFDGRNVAWTIYYDWNPRTERWEREQ